jgi:hypothetical protein
MIEYIFKKLGKKKKKSFVQSTTFPYFEMAVLLTAAFSSSLVLTGFYLSIYLFKLYI